MEIWRQISNTTADKGYLRDGGSQEFSDLGYLPWGAVRWGSSVRVRPGHRARGQWNPATRLFYRDQAAVRISRFGRLGIPPDTRPVLVAPFAPSLRTLQSANTAGIVGQSTRCPWYGAVRLPLTGIAGHGGVFQSKTMPPTSLKMAAWQQWTACPITRVFGRLFIGSGV